MSILFGQKVWMKPLLDPKRSFDSVAEAAEYCFACYGNPLENAKAIASYNLDMGEIGFATELLTEVGNRPSENANDDGLIPFTVVLARTLADRPWEDTFTAHTWGNSAEDAIGAAIREAGLADGQAETEIVPEDYAPTVVIRGHRQIESFGTDNTILVRHPHRYEHVCDICFTIPSPNETLNTSDHKAILRSLQSRIAYLENNPEEILQAIGTVGVEDIQAAKPLKL